MAPGHLVPAGLEEIAAGHMVISTDHPIMGKRFHLLFRPQRHNLLHLDVLSFAISRRRLNRLSQNQVQTNIERLAKLTFHCLEPRV